MLLKGLKNPAAPYAILGQLYSTQYTPNRPGHKQGKENGEACYTPTEDTELGNTHKRVFRL